MISNFLIKIVKNKYKNLKINFLILARTMKKSRKNNLLKKFYYNQFINKLWINLMILLLMKNKIRQKILIKIKKNGALY